MLIAAVPEKASFLNDRQKYIAITRVTMEKKDAHTKHASAKEVLKMLLDWKLAV